MSKNLYTPTIGLEIHAQLKTVTKLFSNSVNDPRATDPNSIVSPIDAAHPGTLPALNYDAVKKVIQVGLAIGADIAEYTEWDRKNYFYPDIPKSYQISQNKYKLVNGGKISGFDVTSIHLEEDTGKSIHDEGDYSLVDLNRAGMPLMELVTEPVLHSGEDAVAFAKELQLLLRYLDAGDANLELGEMRIEANISVSKTDKLGTKVEVKNINSFKAVERAIQYEIDRHIEVLESGGKLIQETRGWDEEKRETFSQRAKEDAHDYRYFPDPDLPKLFISEIFDLAELRASLPSLPKARRASLSTDGLSPDQIEQLVFDNNLYKKYQQVASAYLDLNKVKVANVILTNIVGLSSLEVDFFIDNVTTENIGDLLTLVENKELSSSGLDTALASLYQAPNQAEVIVDNLGLKQNNDAKELLNIAKTVISDNPKVVDEYLAGKESAIKYLMGQGMKLSRGSANPQLLEQVIQSQISA